MRSRAGEILLLAGCALIAAGLWRWSPSLAMVFVGTLLVGAGIITGAPELVMALLGRSPKKVS